MIIIHKIDDFLFNLFPKVKAARKDLEVLREELINYYTYGPYKPKVEISQDFVKIEIDTSSVIRQKAEFDKVVRYCESGKFKKAKPILKKLITKNRTVSEYHRILGQIFSDEGDQEEAINCLIDALRWDSNNTFALIMMGNIFAKHKNDIETAMSFYDQTLVVKPDDHIAMNNIGANLMQLRRINEAEQYFEKAYSINSNYPNTLYALGMTKDMKGDYNAAFDFAVQALKRARLTPPPALYDNAFELANETSYKIIRRSDSDKFFNDYAHKLAAESGKSTDIVADDTIPTPAKLELAENYSREKHIIKYKKNTSAVTHLIMHELVHLDLTVQSRKRDGHYLFVTTNDHKEHFIRDNKPTIQRLNSEGLDDKSITDYINALFSGINSQMYNAPVDLFIEDFLFKTYPALRPFQFVSLLSLLKEYVESARNKQVLKYSPAVIKNANIILSLLHSFQFRDLFGYDMSHLFKSTSQQLKSAKGFYREYLEYQKNDRDLEAHQLVQSWAGELKIEQYFEIIEENKYRSDKSENCRPIEESAHFSPPESKALEQKPVSYTDQPAGQAAVTMYCLGALQYFEEKNLSGIQKVGFEIGRLGTNGINPSDSKKKYQLESIPGKEFTGLQLLAYMYVAFQYIDPHLDTGLSFKKEYETAREMHKKGTP